MKGIIQWMDHANEFQPELVINECSVSVFGLDTRHLLPRHAEWRRQSLFGAVSLHSGGQQKTVVQLSDSEEKVK